MRISRELIEFENKINEYFLECEQNDTYPDEAGMILALGISKETYDKYRENSAGKYSGFKRCIDEAGLRRESIIVRGIYSNESRSPTGKIFLARQPSNGGLSDRPHEDGKKVTIEVLLDGGPSQFD